MFRTMLRPDSIWRRLLLPFLCLTCALALLPSLFLVYTHHGRRVSPIAPDIGFRDNGLRPRHSFSSYEEYLELQLNKTLNAKLREVWRTVDWRRKINVFSTMFRRLLDHGLVERDHKVMCIGARMGQEVVAFKEIGVADAIGIDLVPALPLVIFGDIHHHPFPDGTFDLEFSNVFDHALFPQLFVSEIERTLKPSGVAVLHVALHTRSDRFSANDLLSVDALLALFKHSEIVYARRVDAFGLDTEVVMRKKSNLAKPCSKVETAVLKQAEPLILTEPDKPWITLKKNMKSVKYLPTITEIGHHRRCIYVDIGARDYGSSIGSWFQKAYPKQGRNFSIYAIEADSSFEQSYASHSEVTFMPYAAWIRNESLMFGSDNNYTGMGRIHHLPQKIEGRFKEVQGLDIAEWFRNLADEDDLLVVKMDIEGAEFDLLPKLLDTGAICLVDELFLECHYNRWQHRSPGRTTKYNRTYQDCLSLFNSLRHNGLLVHQWW